MPKFLIERVIPNIGEATSEELIAIAQSACAVLSDMGSSIQWLHSYVIDDKLTCIYIAPSRAMILEHARRGGFIANRISEVRAIIDPASACGAVWLAAREDPECGQRLRLTG